MSTPRGTPRVNRRAALLVAAVLLALWVPAAGAYTVKPGDSLWSIAERFDTTVTALAKANGLDPDAILPVGLDIEIPSKTCEPATYQVQPGDTLSALAHRFDTTVAALAKANELDPNGILIAGTSLRVDRADCATKTAAGATPPQSAGNTAGFRRSALATALGRALARKGVSARRTGAVVIDLETGKTIFEQNGRLPLRPASAEKLAVALTALRVLGPSFSATTRVLGEGRRVGRAWKGDVVLVGSGDPGLSSRDLAALADQVRARGIRSVRGSVLGDESRFDTVRGVTGWKGSFVKSESPPLSALVVDRGTLDGAIADQPALAAAIRFTRALSVAGISVSGEPAVGRAGPGAAQLAEHASEPLSSLVEAIGTWSDNFVSEMLLKQLGAHILGRGTSKAGAKVVVRSLQSLVVPLEGVRIVDASGLSRYDRLTARSLAGLLAAADADPALGPRLRGALALAGSTGTLRNRLASGPARLMVRAKTGTTDSASALAGYVGTRYAFAVLVNGSPVPLIAAHAAEDAFAQALAAAAG